jgi:carbonic anhydrase/acetyltransferase-like protein (isoleucine patch superfamily)
MAIYQLGDDKPVIPASAYVAPEATLIGKIILGENASIWPGAILRGDNEPILIGAGSNVQDGAVMHTDPGFPLTVGENVTIGHQVMLHGCTISDGCLIGIQSVIMNGAVIGKNCLVGAGSLITEGKTFAERKLIVGAPARALRDLSDDDIAKFHRAAPGYVRKQFMYKQKLKRID